ncbi:hypothetical protein PoB_007197700 [Plakobranchus ocellatus]|uniref:Secreted protein n=1 Tax=Plakobranchus ocellatus TaxID=259542 RepID=A0AAV4DMY7_9GAST|nr:hypothetical protein PoB_007197700 [Plakobranchus ocellatus]
MYLYHCFFILLKRAYQPLSRTRSFPAIWTHCLMLLFPAQGRAEIVSNEALQHHNNSRVTQPLTAPIPDIGHQPKLLTELVETLFVVALLLLV